MKLKSHWKSAFIQPLICISIGILAGISISPVVLAQTSVISENGDRYLLSYPCATEDAIAIFNSTSEGRITDVSTMRCI
ncbi:hypothetical protein NDA03_13545 [Trichocoleus sp. Lan]|uniref:hypothetical protein n=1 Tax=Trichocoleus sp. Lan TaxID=2933927 RepID=UPI00329686ED